MESILKKIIREAKRKKLKVKIIVNTRNVYHTYESESDSETEEGSDTEKEP